MTIGTTTELNESRYTIVSDALMLLGVNEAGENIADADMQLGVRWLNRLVKQWEASGVHLNTNAYATLFLQPGVREYILGSESAGLAHWATDPITQTLTVTASASTSSITVDSTALVTQGDHVGIVDNNNLVQWTTVATVSSSTVLILTDALLVTSNVGNVVFSYTSRPSSGAPLKVLDANLVQNVGANTSETLLPILSFEDFFQLTNKQQLGIPINMVYDKKIDTGNVNVWLTPSSSAYRIRLHYQRPIFDFDLTSDTQDLPPQYLSAIVYNLAISLAPSYGKSALLQTLIPVGQQMLAQIESFDQESISCYLSPSKYRY